MRVAVTPRSALVLVDVQRDFCPGGALPAKEGDKVVPVLNDHITRFHQRGFAIVATRDWHPERHVSFQERGGPWPRHCVQGTEGAAFHPDLALPKEAAIISKATDPDQDAYSGFQGTGLASQLRGLKVERLFIGGLATDYCVKQTVLDALGHGFQVVVLDDAIRGVDVKHGDSDRAKEEMLRAGAAFARYEEILA